jgi:hypothetical protein
MHRALCGKLASSEAMAIDASGFICPKMGETNPTTIAPCTVAAAMNLSTKALTCSNSKLSSCTSFHGNPLARHVLLRFNERNETMPEQNLL